MQCLGEMVAFLPLPGAIPQFGSRFVDEAMGFALGWNVGLDLTRLQEKIEILRLAVIQNWYSGALAVCTDISAAAVVIQYWNDTVSVSEK